MKIYLILIIANAICLLLKALDNGKGDDALDTWSTILGFVVIVILAIHLYLGGE